MAELLVKGITELSCRECAKKVSEMTGQTISAMGAKEFHGYREAAIAEKYNLDEVNERILNADGASWIKKVKDKSTRFQLAPLPPQQSREGENP